MPCQPAGREIKIYAYANGIELCQTPHFVKFIKGSKKITVAILIGLAMLILLNNKQLRSQIFGTIKYRDVRMRAGNIEIPYERNLPWENTSAFADSTIQDHGR